jgi:acetyl-CoA carboxylase carboxyltransferase component
VDAVIEPRDTRPKNCITALRMLETKRDTNVPPKKHGNIPLSGRECGQLS